VTDPILPITPAIARACDSIDELVRRFISACRALPSALGKYESSVEAQNLFRLAIRNVEGVIQLAKSDLVLLPPAMAAARAAFEAAVKACWLVDPEDPYDREARYLVQLHSEERYLQRLAKRFDAAGISSSNLHVREGQIREFRLAVTAALPAGVRRLSGTPSFDEMLAAIGGGKIYAFYILLSQYGHGEHAATWLYRDGGLGTERKDGEFVKPEQWLIPLRTCLHTLGHPGRIFIARLGGDEDQFLDAADHQIIEDQLSRIVATGTSHSPSLTPRESKLAPAGGKIIV